MKLMRLMIDGGLYERYPVEGLITELEIIKVMVLPDGQEITTELIKKLREIIDVLTMHT
jgi:hypothetical protein